MTILLHLFIRERESRDIKKNERSGEKKGTNDIGQPMRTRHEPSNHSDEGKEEAKDSDCQARYTGLYTMPTGKGCRAENTASKHGVRGRVGCFQGTFDKNGAIIDDDELKQQVKKRNKSIESAKQQKLAIDRPKALAGGKLKDSDQSKYTCNAKGEDAEELGKVIPKSILSDCLEDSLVDACEADLC